MQRSHTPRVFISYSWRDREFAENLASSLTRDGITVWFDRWHIHVGDSIARKVNDGLSSADFLLILLTPSSVESEWVGRELDVATIREIEARKVTVLPILAEECPIPPLLLGKKYADFTKDPAKAYEDLLAAIDHNCGSVRRETLNDKRLAIIHRSTAVENDLPVSKFTVANRSGRSQIILKLEYDVVEYHPYASIPASRTLEPLAVWDIRLPYGEGSYSYIPDSPILIANDDAATISLRFSCSHTSGLRMVSRKGDSTMRFEGHSTTVSPGQVAYYKVRVRFLSDRQLIAVSEIFKI